MQRKHYDVAAYIWPAYTGDEPRSHIFWPAGDGEWQTVRSANARSDGHTWHRKPLWGYNNEADPYTMEMQIEAAVDHGINTFIYNWYWYDNRPFLEQCLNDGFLKARNNHKMKFFLMWANHNATFVWDRRLAHQDDKTVIWQAEVNRQQFEKVMDRIINNYFAHPSYYKLDGCPLFQIYDLNRLVTGLGGLSPTAEALSWFRQRVIDAGFAGLNLQLTCIGANQLNLSGVDAKMMDTPSQVVNQLGIDSLTHYHYVHFTNIDRDYQEIMIDVESEWAKLDTHYQIPYFPHVSIGWDNNPRFQVFRPGIVKNNSPGAIEKGLLAARDYIDSHGNQAPLVTINSWNEWTETSYLQPDNVNGYGYLEAVKSVFKST
jgi:hypothetical protein